MSWHGAHHWIRSRKQKHSANLSRLIPFSIPMKTSMYWGRGEQGGQNVWMELNGGENHRCGQPRSDISLPPIPAPEKSITSKKLFFFFFGKAPVVSATREEESKERKKVGGGRGGIVPASRFFNLFTSCQWKWWPAGGFLSFLFFFSPSLSGLCICSSKNHTAGATLWTSVIFIVWWRRQKKTDRSHGRTQLSHWSGSWSCWPCSHQWIYVDVPVEISQVNSIKMIR